VESGETLLTVMTNFNIIFNFFIQRAKYQRENYDNIFSNSLRTYLKAYKILGFLPPHSDNQLSAKLKVKMGDDVTMLELVERPRYIYSTEVGGCSQTRK
jgi:hypothetical protein